MLSKQYVVCSESHLSSSIFLFNEKGDVQVSCIASCMHIPTCRSKSFNVKLCVNKVFIGYRSAINIGVIFIYAPYADYYRLHN